MTVRRVLCGALAWACLSLNVAAQEAKPSIFAVESVAAVEGHLGANASTAWGLTIDTVISAALGGGVQVIARPIVTRALNGVWNRQIQPITLRYERRGPVGVRVDGGFIPAPIGTGMLTIRPHQNPTIAQPAYYFQALPPFELRGTAARLLSATYPLGAQLTLSTTKWDARVAVIDSSPARPRRVFGTNPPRFAQVVAGAGVSPVFGMRIGATVAHGGWTLRLGSGQAEAPSRNATFVAIEGEYGFNYTKLTAEWVIDRFDVIPAGGAGATDTVTVTPSGWYVQAVQTLAPRWFLAGRVERISTEIGVPLPPPGGGASGVLRVPQRFAGTEITLGYRINPELTVRGGHRAREQFGRPVWDHLASVSLVWARRWM